MMLTLPPLHVSLLTELGTELVTTQDLSPQHPPPSPPPAPPPAAVPLLPNTIMGRAELAVKIFRGI